LSKENKMEMST